MFDTMTLTKAVGSVCGALLAFLLITWVSEPIYHGGHGDGEQAYRIDTGADDAAAEDVAEEGPSFEELFAAADPEAGAGLWRQCAACHKLDGTNGTGPYLNGVVDRPKASVEGYAYSAGMAGQAGDVWSPANLDAFLESPRTYTPGTKMTYNGLRGAADRANLIAYLATLDG